MPVGMPEFVDNPEPRCPVILLCDTSGSMSGAPINNLNAGLAAFRQEVFDTHRRERTVILGSMKSLAQAGLLQPE